MGKISAGSYDLNKWLYGGYEQGIATVLYGGPGTGKTNFCLLTAVSQAKKNKKVIYIDTEAGFSVERIKQLAKEETDRVLQNILVLKPTTFTEQKKVFETLSRHIKNEVSLIIVDSMTILYRLDFASAREHDILDIQKTNTDFVRQMRTLTEIAQKRDLPILVTSQIYKWEDTTKIVGGDILAYWGKCLIELVNEHGKRTAILQKHRHLPLAQLNFQITNESIRKRGWL